MDNFYDSLRSPKIYHKTCTICGREFLSKKNFSKFCSNQCRSKNLKLNKIKNSETLNIYNRQSLPEDLSQKIINWRNIPKNKKIVILQNGSRSAAIQKLKELNYPEYLTVKPISFSDDNKLLVTVNIIQQYTIEMFDS